MQEKPHYKGFIGDKMPCDREEFVEVFYRAPGQIVRHESQAKYFDWNYVENENIICYRIIK